MLTRLLLKVFMVLGLMLMFGCSSGGDDIEGPPSENPPEYVAIDSVSIPAGMRQSADSHAQLAVAYVDLLNSFNSLVILPPAAKKSAEMRMSLEYDPDWVLKDTIGELIITFNIFESEDFYAWDWVFDGSDGVHDYEGWLAMHQECHKTLGFGGFIVYAPMTENIDVQWSWGFYENGTYRFEMNNQADSEKASALVNSDGSGSVEYYLLSGADWIIQFGADWNADGSGHWWEYEDGVNIDDGTWQ